MHVQLRAQIFSSLLFRHLLQACTQSAIHVNALCHAYNCVTVQITVTKAINGKDASITISAGGASTGASAGGDSANGSNMAAKPSEQPMKANPPARVCTRNVAWCTWAPFCQGNVYFAGCVQHMTSTLLRPRSLLLQPDSLTVLPVVAGSAIQGSLLAHSRCSLPQLTMNNHPCCLCCCRT